MQLQCGSLWELLPPDSLAFFRVNAHYYAGVNERTEEKAGVGSPSAPSDGDEAYSSAAALSALGRAQIKRGLGVSEQSIHANV